MKQGSDGEKGEKVALGLFSVTILFISLSRSIINATLSSGVFVWVCLSGILYVEGGIVNT